MGFEEEFAVFLFRAGAVRFGEFTLSSGRSSPYYVDLRLVPSHPHQFRRMVRRLQGQISDTVGLGSFDSMASVPTGGLVIASALALETVKPLIYVRADAKRHGTSRAVEGVVTDGTRAIMIDDVATTGGSIMNAVGTLRDAGVEVSDAFAVLDRSEGAGERLAEQGVRLHRMADIAGMARSLHAAGLVRDDVLRQVEDRTR